MSARVSRIALVVFVVGLALHNLVMAELWDAGIRGTSLDVVAAWKDVLLAVPSPSRSSVRGRCRSGSGPTGSLSLYAALVLLYWLLPQSWLGGAATRAVSSSPLATT